MSLLPGTRLGPYEVVTPIGQGGMGEVYRATDTNLKRPVAIKVLPDDVAPTGTASAVFSAKPKYWLRSTTRTSRRSTGSRKPAAPRHS